VDLSQENTNIAIPMLLSTNGYGIFWNNTSRSKFNNRFVHYLYLTAEVADTIDYYFIYGPEFDRIVAGYRALTGAAPMFGKWAYGFWQCKNRYKSQAEILEVAEKYRQLHIPVDNIVQDWFWWTKTGEFVFNQNYPDPKKMIDDLHRLHVHLMVSPFTRLARLFTTPPIRRPAPITGTCSTTRCSKSAPTPGGKTPPNRRPKEWKRTYSFETKPPSAAAPATPIFIQ
jgi:alpha-D-xyloside xylohydrolase